MNNCMKAVGKLLTHVAMRRGKKSTGLRTKLPARVRARALLAGTVTRMPIAAPVEEKPPKPESMSKQDIALRKLAAEAPPGKCHTLHEISEVMGITRERVRQIEMKAKRTFRNRLTTMLKSEGVSPSDVAAVFSAARIE